MKSPIAPILVASQLVKHGFGLRMASGNPQVAVQMIYYYMTVQRHVLANQNLSWPLQWKLEVGAPTCIGREMHP